MKFLNESEVPNKTHLRILILSWAGWVFDFYDLILFTFLLIPIGKELSLSNISLSLVLGSSLAATAFGGIVFGILSDKIGRKNVLQWTILTYSLGTFLSGFSPNLATLLVFRIITGLGVGGEWATGQTFVGETFPAKVRGRYAAYMQTGAPFGILIASLVGGFLEPAIGWRFCFFISVAPAALVVFVRRHLPESDVWSEHKRIMSGEGKDERSSQLGKSFKPSYLIFREYLDLFVKALVLAIFLMSAYWFTYSWLPGYLHEERHFTLARSALWMVITQGGGLLGYSTFGLIADWIGRRPTFAAYSLFWAVGLFMVTIFWNAVVSYPAVILAFMFIVGFGTGVFSGFGPLCAEIFPTGIRNTAMGAAFNLARGVQFFTPLIIALIGQKYGLSAGIALAGMFALLTGVWIWVFPETKGKKIVVI
jgi:MFS family permease